MWNKVFTFVCLALVFSPQCLVGSDMFGTFTYRGKVVDADTLQPIQGAVVVAEWYKCWPGIGAGELCDFSMAKEALTDANGEWSITGPKGNRKPSLARQVFGFVISWNRPPEIRIFKLGYFRLYQMPGYFVAWPYVDKDKDLEGIVLIRMGKTKEEEREFIEKFIKLNKYPFIALKEPEKKLRDLNFGFQYPASVMVVDDDVVNERNYCVIGLKKALTDEEKKKARLLPSDIEHWSQLPLLRKVIENSIE